MASRNLDLINKQLITLRDNAKSAEQAITYLTGQLQQMLAQAAKGTPTQAGLSGAVERLVTGTAGASPRVGGGAYVPASAIAQMDPVIRDIAMERLRLATLQLKEEALKARTAQLGPLIDDAYFTKNIQTFFQNVFKYIDDNLVQLLQQRYNAIQKMSGQGGLAGGGFNLYAQQNYQPPPPGWQGNFSKQQASNPNDIIDALQLELPNIPIPVEQLNKVAVAVSKIEAEYLSLGESIKKITPQVKEIDGNFLHFTETIETSNRNLKTLDFYLDRTGNILTKSDLRSLRESEIAAARQEALNKPISFMGPAGQREYDQFLQRQVEGFKKLGITFDRTKTSADALNDGYLKFTNTLTSSNGIQKQVIVYMDQQGNLLDEITYKTKQAAEAQRKWNESQLKMGLTPTRARTAMGEAERMGFQLENLRKVYTQEPSGVSFLNFERMDEVTGVMYKGQVAVDRFGSVLTQTNRRLLSFTDSIIRNTAEVFRWSIGATLVYQAYFKLGDLVRTAIDNQAKLTDVTIALGDANRDLSNIFGDVATVAAATGESINSVLETYTMAYRAVGSATNDIERTIAANKLLYQATVLNKLSTLDAASSIDVLAGSLRQLAQPQETTLQAFERGDTLLNQWVALTRRANVDLATLATAFSITAESAANTGVNVKELNAIIASLAEKIGGLGGRETGNAVRALIGGVYQQQAAGALAQYGIAVTNTAGDMRDFLDISRDIFELWKTGIIDDSQITKLAYVLGGGVRRGQQYVAFLTDFAKVQEFVNVQTNAGEAAQEALGKKLDTVQTSITQVSNAFQRLAQSMGDQGGVLGVATALLTVIEKLVNGFADLNSVLGQIAIPATLTALGALYMRLGSQPASDRIFSGQRALGTSLTDYLTYSQFGGKERFKNLFLGQQLTPSPFASFAGNFVSRGGLIGLGLTASSAISRFGQGQTAAGVANLAGSIGGALLGTLAGPAGPIVGSVIGTAIADSFAKAAMEHEEDFQSLFSDVYKEVREDTEDKPKVGEAIRTEAERTIYELIGAGNEAVGRWGIEMGTTLENAIYRALGGLPDELNKALQDVGLGIEGEFQGLTELQAAYLNAYRAGKITPDVMAKLQQAREFTPESIPYEESAFALRQKEIEKSIDEFTTVIAAQFRNSLRKQLAAGEVPAKQYEGGIKTSYTLDASVSRGLAVLTEEGEDFNKILDDINISLEEFSNILLKSSDENLAYLSQLGTQISDIDRLIESLTGKADDLTVDFLGKDYTKSDLAGLKEDLQALYIEYLKMMQATQKIPIAEAAQAKIPPIIDAEGIATPDNIRAIEDAAMELQQAFYDEMVSMGLIESSEADSILSNTAPILVSMGEGMGYYLMEGLVNSDFLQQALEMQATGLSFEFMTDITMAQLQAILPQYEAMKAAIIALGGVVNEVTQLVFLAGMTTPVPLTYDWKIIQFLLSQILETNVKQEKLQEKELQLEGVYNLPGGASFYVPFDAYAMGAGKKEGTEDESEAAEALEAAADNLLYASEALLESIHAALNPETLQWDKFSPDAQIQRLIDSLFPGEPGFQQDPTPQKLQEVLEQVRAIRAKLEEPDKPSPQTGWSGFPPRSASEGGWSPSTQTGWMGMPTETIDPLTEAIKTAISEGLTADEALGSILAEAIRTGFSELTPEVLFGDFINDSINNLIQSIESLITAIEGFNPFDTSYQGETGSLQNIKQPVGGSLASATFEDMQLSYADMMIGSANLTIPLDVSTRLTINFYTKTDLVVDGAVLAEVVKPYLYSGLVQYQNSTSTVTRSQVI